MGRRSINTTKSGKYMNPTDQASKYETKRRIICIIFEIYLILPRKGAAKEGAQEKQEATSNGKTSCAEK